MAQLAEVVVPMLAFAHRFLMMLQAISMGEGVKGCALADMAAMAAMAIDGYCRLLAMGQPLVGE